MSKQYAPLGAARLKAGAGIHTPLQSGHRHVGPDDPAIMVVTDFKETRALTIGANASIRSALERMIVGGVRLLLVVDAANMVVGLVTSTDIEGEKPLRIIESRRVGRDDVNVGDVMTPREQVEAVDMSALLRARVGDVVATFKAAGRRHALVVDTDEDGIQTLRGILSASQVERQLGAPIDTFEIARNFAELEVALAH